MQLSPEVERLYKILYPFAFHRYQAVKAAGTRFVHYTSADAAVNILRTKEVWMRKTSCMNDFSEVQHGLDCLVTAYNSENGNLFKDLINSIFDGITVEVEQLFNGWIPHFQNDTYIACFSEHRDDEDLFGRLSMWRAYGEAHGVAFVMNTAPFFSPSNALKAYSNPVAYLNDEGFSLEFQRITSNVENERDFIAKQDRELVTAFIFNAFKFAALCTKHSGFAEEIEWRVVYSPKMEASAHVQKDIKIIKGIPQPIYKVPLRDIPDEGFTGVEIPSLLDRIIIGPAEYPSVMLEAFRDLLFDAGVKEPQEKVFISFIPLRR